MSKVYLHSAEHSVVKANTRVTINKYTDILSVNGPTTLLFFF